MPEVRQVVVAAAIVRGHPPTHVLATQRAYPHALAGQWEFPGGKVERDEDEQDALRRECREELGLDVVVGDRIGPDVVIPDGDYVLHVWTATAAGGALHLREHADARWLAASELGDVGWLAVDAPVVAAVQRLLATRLPDCPA
ncbi:MAG: (deoxy)nucleoside triphosphate pyrophosphohydrolase [Frankia sp.]|nr:(deoxy)nucleoside triphosphate pyrophosphohydrolase [Frankia sp.]